MKFIVLFALFASSYAGVVQQQHGIVAQQAVAVAAAPVVASAPQQYSHQIQAAAIRNVETVGVTKTITPVVTKTTTTRLHSEPAISVGYVQGYTQSAQGPAQVAPVQYNTQYTSYLNPTVGLNGPVSYAGPAVQTGVAVAAQPVAAYASTGPAIAQYASAGPALAQYASAGPALAQYAVPAQASYATGISGIHSAGLYSVQPAYAATQQALIQHQAIAVQPQGIAVQPQIAAYGSPALGYSKY